MPKQIINVEAIQFDGTVENFEEIKSFVGNKLAYQTSNSSSDPNFTYILIWLKENNDLIRVYKDDYIIKNPDGTFSRCPQVVFENYKKAFDNNIQENYRRIFRCVINKWLSLEGPYEKVEDEYLPWEPSEYVEELFGLTTLAAADDDDILDREADAAIANFLEK